MHDGLVAVGEQAVVFGDGAGADRVVGFHAWAMSSSWHVSRTRPSRGSQLKQVFEQLAERAGADDSARAAAFGERHIEQLLRRRAIW